MASIVVGIIDVAIGTAFNTELFVWIALSILSVSAWIAWFKKSSVTQSGQSNYRLDTLGSVTQSIKPHDRGKVTFDSPVVGNISWHATAKVEIAVGSRIQIVEINGQLIEVEPVPPTQGA